MAADAFDGLNAYDQIVASAWPGRTVARRVIYGGTESQERSYARIISWRDIHQHE